MTKWIRKHGFLISSLGGIVLYAASLLMVAADKTFTYRWVGFWLSIGAVGFVFLPYIFSMLRPRHIRKVLNEREVFTFGLLFVFVEAINFLFITTYPFVSLGDEVRDGGLNAMQIANGSLLNIFGYGAYNAHGLIIPTITSIFYHVFGSSVLTYRFPAAMLICLEVVCIYLLLRNMFGKTVAFLCSLLLATMPLQLFFARTQVVVAFNIFWSATLLLALYIFLQKQRKIDFVFLGTMIGFICGFHAGIRVMALLLVIAIVCMQLSKIIRNVSSGKQMLHHIVCIALLLIFSFVGFGPRVLFTNTTNFFHTSRFILQQNTSTPKINVLSELQTIGNNYLQSLGVWMVQPTNFFYPDHQPLFPPFIALFFIVGIVVSLFVFQESFLNLLIFLAVTIPFFASAITDAVNADQRIATLLPIGIVIVGVGIYFMLRALRKKPLQHLFIGIIILFALFQGYGFFVNQPAGKNGDLKDYLSMHVIYFLQTSNGFLPKKNSQSHPASICMVVSSKNEQSFTLLHYQEQYEYFLPQYNISVKGESKIHENEAYIFSGACPESYASAMVESIYSCIGKSVDFLCPPGYSGEIKIHY